MSWHLQIDSFGERIVDRELMRFGENLQNPTHALEAIGDLLRIAVAKQFATEGGHASGGWPKLSEARVKEKARLGLDPHILRATDALMGSLVNKFDSKHIERASGETLTFGSTVSYGVYHQASGARTKMPYRPPVALTQADKRGMVKVLQAELLKGMDKAVWGA